MSIEQLTQAVMALPESERRELVRTLIDTLPPDDEEFDPEFMEELLRRDGEMESGRVNGLSHRELMAKARKALE